MENKNIELNKYIYDTEYVRVAAGLKPFTEFTAFLFQDPLSRQLSASCDSLTDAGKVRLLLTLVSG